MSPASPKKVTALRGHVSSGPYGTGSKSERKAVFIDTATQRYLLRRTQGPVFGDDELTQYLGHDVECDGHLLGSTLLADSIRRVR